jgi:hypothetical protein
MFFVLSFLFKLVVGKDEQNQRVNSIYMVEVGGSEQRMLPNNNDVMPG